jgi:hypothetical protein
MFPNGRVGRVDVAKHIRALLFDAIAFQAEDAAVHIISLELRLHPLKALSVDPSQSIPSKSSDCPEYSKPELLNAKRLRKLIVRTPLSKRV